MYRLILTTVRFVRATQCFKLKFKRKRGASTIDKFETAISFMVSYIQIIKYRFSASFYGFDGVTCYQKI